MPFRRSSANARSFSTLLRLAGDNGFVDLIPLQPSVHPQFELSYEGRLCDALDPQNASPPRRVSTTVNSTGCRIRGTAGRILGIINWPQITVYEPNHGGAGVAKEKAKAQAPRPLLLGM